MIRFLTAALCALFTALPACAADSPPVVLELFTSQGCSSCPPADQLMTELAREPGVIALSCHVTYWDRGSQKDPLARDFCTQRQYNYSDRHKDRSVYTPQMIVNGQPGFVGSRRSEALAEIQHGIQSAAVAPIGLTEDGNGGLLLTLPALAHTGDYSLWMFGLKRSQTEKIAFGENRGRTVHYVNIANTLEHTGLWDGEAGTRTLRLPAASPDIKRVAVIAQLDGNGPIAAAGVITLAP